MGQTYFGDFKLPDGSLYKPIESTIAANARGEDGFERMDLTEYTNEVVSRIIQGETGKFWYGNNAESTKHTIKHLDISVMVSLMILGPE